MPLTQKKPNGIGVVDTSSLWAAANFLDSRPTSSQPTLSSPNQAVNSSEQREHFTALMHNIILYDELRTDFDVLAREDSSYSGPIKTLVDRLAGAVAVAPLPSTVSDFEIMEEILPMFFDALRRNHGDLGAPAYPLRETPFNWAMMNAFHADPWQSELDVHGGGGLPPDFVRKFEAVYVSFLASRRVQTGSTAAGDEEQATVWLESAIRALSVVARTIRYAMHSRFLQTQEGLPSAFCASPRRIQLLQDYVDHDQFEAAKEQAVASPDLFSRLGLPKSGYDFSGLVAKPLSLSDLGRAIAHLSPDEAVDLVLRIYDTDAAQELRGVWAERLWSAGSHALEGYSQVIRDVTVGGDLWVQLTAVPAGSASLSGGTAIRHREAGSARSRVLDDLRRRRSS